MSIDFILRRRSIRRFEEKPVEHEKIKLILKAAMAAPSAMNRRPWEFIVVTDEAKLSRIRKSLLFGRYKAPLAIVVCGDTSGLTLKKLKDLWVQDCSAATENLLIAAANIGLGAVWLAVYPFKGAVKRISSIVGLDSKIIPLCVVYVGYPAEEKEARTQYDEKKVHWNTFGQRRTSEE
ncbi:MAG: hypothetical protein XE05_1019 [Thermotogales bacterium 46_20]|nr:MAG: hypothetical protein XE05_1019 [Thermotogales bacterium 46_20]